MSTTVYQSNWSGKTSGPFPGPFAAISDTPTIGTANSLTDRSGMLFAFSAGVLGVSGPASNVQVPLGEISGAETVSLTALTYDAVAIQDGTIETTGFLGNNNNLIVQVMRFTPGESETNNSFVYVGYRHDAIFYGVSGSAPSFITPFASAIDVSKTYNFQCSISGTSTITLTFDILDVAAGNTSIVNKSGANVATVYGPYTAGLFGLAQGFPNAPYNNFGITGLTIISNDSTPAIWGGEPRWLPISNGIQFTRSPNNLTGTVTETLYYSLSPQFGLSDSGVTAVAITAPYTLHPPDDQVRFYKRVITNGTSTFTSPQLGMRRWKGVINISVIGDSISSVSYGPITYFSAFCVKKQIFARITNCAVVGSETADWTPGSSTNYLSSQIATAEQIFGTPNPSTNPVYWLCMLGANDSRNSVPAATYQSNITSTVNALTTAGYTIQLNAPTFQYFGPGGAGQDTAQPYLFQYQAALEAIVATVGDSSKCYLGDTSLLQITAANPQLLDQLNGLHPITPAQPIYAEAWFEALLSHIGLAPVYPGQSYVITTAPTYGPTGTEYSGTAVLPGAADVRLGTTVGATTGTLHVPTASQTLLGVAVDATTGNVTLPSTGNVVAPTTFGANLSETGTASSGGSGITLSQLNTALASGITTLDLTQPIAAAVRALDSVADSGLVLGDALIGAVATAAGKEAIVGTSYTIKTPSTGTAIRTFTLDSATNPTSRS